MIMGVFSLKQLSQGLYILIAALEFKSKFG